MSTSVHARWKVPCLSWTRTNYTISILNSNEVEIAWRAQANDFNTMLWIFSFSPFYYCIKILTSFVLIDATLTIKQKWVCASLPGLTWEKIPKACICTTNSSDLLQCNVTKILLHPKSYHCMQTDDSPLPLNWAIFAHFASVFFMGCFCTVCSEACCSMGVVGDLLQRHV